MIPFKVRQAHHERNQTLNVRPEPVEGLTQSFPETINEFQQLGLRTWVANSAQVVLSWPGYFAADKAIHQAIAQLDVGSELILRARSDGQTGWELADKFGVAVTRMSQAFAPPEGEIIKVRVAAIHARQKKSSDLEALRCDHWEVVLPEISYLPGNS